ncbi:MAG: hypothetical protein MZV70_28955 [Desulfobacterales bacterium]|nr:hypothetical protein [Desulfobacterales bacterium]
MLMLPGERVFFICSNRPLQTDIPDLLRRKGIATLYISGYYEGNVTPERISYLRGQMDPAAPPNAELAPYVMRAVFSEWFAKFRLFAAVVHGRPRRVCWRFYFWRASRVEFVLFSAPDGWPWAARSWSFLRFRFFLGIFISRSASS